MGVVRRDIDLGHVQGAYAALDDRMLVLDFQAGNPGAFVEIYDRYGGLARSVCRKILTNEQDADEAYQETMVRVFQGLHRFNGQYALAPWVSRIATNVSIDALRTRDRRPAIDGSPLDEHDYGDPSDGPETAYERLVERDLVIAVLSELPETHRTALVLRELEGRSHKEIAATLGISPAQTKALIHRAKGSFRRGWFRALAERGGVMGIAALPLVWLFRGFEGARRLVDRLGGHAAQIAQAATPDVVSTAANSPAVVAGASVGERLVATGMAVLVAGGVTVGAATIVKHQGPAQGSAASASPAPQVSSAPVVIVPAVHREREERPRPIASPSPSEVPVEETPSDVPSDATESPAPTESPTADPSPSESPVPPVIPPAPAWTYAFGSSTGSVESCACDATTTATPAQLVPGDDGTSTFSQGVSGGAFDAEGDVTWPFSLQQWGTIRRDGSGVVEYRFRLTSAAGTFLYYGSGTLAETMAGDEGSTSYRFEGTFELMAPQVAAPGLPSRGFASVTVGVWQDGSLYTGSFHLEDASS